MKTLKKKRRIQVLMIATLALIASTALIGYAMRDGINFFRSPTDVLAEPPRPDEVFRIGGLVQAGTLVRGQGDVISFNVTDGYCAIEVRYRGVLPDLFAENEDMVGLGTYDGAIFTATEILAKHDEEYRPKEVTEALEAREADQIPSECTATNGTLSNS
ncbi:MAG: cytochrome c maturation protein CcmE [Pseudomonadota bacterium]